MNERSAADTQISMRSDIGYSHGSMSTFTIRPIEKKDDVAIASIIRSVMTEHGAVGDGFSINDPEVNFISQAYCNPQSAYFVADEDGEVLGGAGIAPLVGGEAHVCELKKMYILPQARGRGVGQALMTACLESAARIGFRECYLETLANMNAAQALYAKYGFAPLNGPMGATGHSGCNTWMLKRLDGSSKK